MTLKWRKVPIIFIDSTPDPTIGPIYKIRNIPFPNYYLSSQYLPYRSVLEIIGINNNNIFINFSIINLSF